MNYGKETTTIMSLGNAGFLVIHGRFDILIDPFFQVLPSVKFSFGADRTDVILITHDHWDHFNADRIVEVADRTNIICVGPQPIVRRLKRLAPAVPVVELEPTAAGASVQTQVGNASITAFRTLHGIAHNSYLVELPGLRLFHDGDNEDTRCLDRSMLKHLDALMICPWRGSDWERFIDALQPRYWFLMHMTEEELNQHERDKFFPELCDHVPAGLVTLRPGETQVIKRSST